MVKYGLADFPNSQFLFLGAHIHHKEKNIIIADTLSLWLGMVKTCFEASINGVRLTQGVTPYSPCTSHIHLELWANPKKNCQKPSLTMKGPSENFKKIYIELPIQFLRQVMLGIALVFWGNFVQAYLKVPGGCVVTNVFASRHARA